MGGKQEHLITGGSQRGLEEGCSGGFLVVIPNELL